MKYGIFSALGPAVWFFLAIVVTRLLVAKFQRNGWTGGPKLTSAQLRAYIKANNTPGMYLAPKGLLFAEVIMACAATAGAVFYIITGGLVDGWRAALEPAAVFFFPSPGVYVFIITALIPLLLSCLCIALFPNLLLKGALRSQYQVISGNSPAGDIIQGLKIAIVAWLLAMPFMALAVHNYSAVTPEKVIANPYFSVTDRTVALRDILQVTLMCKAEKGEAIRPTLKAYSSSEEYVIWGQADSGLNLVAPSDVQHLYQTFRENDITVVRSINPDCEAATKDADPKVAALYNALFHPGEPPDSILPR